MLFIAVAYLAADLTSARVEQSLTVLGRPVAVNSTNHAVVPGPPLATLGNPNELQTVLNNTAGHVPVGNATTTAVVNGTTINVTAAANTTAPPAGSLPLPKLTGTLAGGGHSLAVLQAGDETRVCAVGEIMSGYTVVSVTQFGATLRDSAGGEHRLSLDLAGGQMAAPAPLPGPAATPTSIPNRMNPMPNATPPADGAISVSQIKQWIDNPGPWMGHMNVKPFKKGDEVAGMQVNYSVADNPLAKLGINAGDVVTNLNGHPLKGPEDLSWVLSELRNNPNLSFQLERGGQAMPLDIHLSDN